MRFRLKHKNTNGVQEDYMPDMEDKASIEKNGVEDAAANLLNSAAEAADKIGGKKKMSTGKKVLIGAAIGAGVAAAAIAGYEIYTHTGDRAAKKPSKPTQKSSGFSAAW